MSKHTPGPWITDGLQIRTASGELVAGTIRWHLGEIAVANARLISAAPDLAEVLTMLLDPIHHPYVDVEAKARAALSKAGIEVES